MPRRKRSKTWLKVVVFLVLLAAAAVIWYLVWDNYFKDKGTSDNVVTSSSEVKKPQKKEDKPKEEEKKEELSVSDNKTPQQYEGEDPNAMDEITGIITYAGVSGDILMIQVTIDQYLKDGTCTLELMSGEEKVYTSAVKVVDMVTTSTCDGFDVPVMGLPKGELDVNVIVNADGKKGRIVGVATI